MRHFDPLSNKLNEAEQELLNEFKKLYNKKSAADKPAVAREITRQIILAPANAKKIIWTGFGKPCEQGVKLKLVGHHFMLYIKTLKNSQNEVNSTISTKEEKGQIISKNYPNFFTKENKLMDQVKNHLQSFMSHSQVEKLCDFCITLNINAEILSKLTKLIHLRLNDKKIFEIELQNTTDPTIKSIINYYLELIGVPNQDIEPLSLAS